MKMYTDPETLKENEKPRVPPSRSSSPPPVRPAHNPLVSLAAIIVVILGGLILLGAVHDAMHPSVTYTQCDPVLGTCSQTYPVTP